MPGYLRYRGDKWLRQSVSALKVLLLVVAFLSAVSTFHSQSLDVLSEHLRSGNVEQKRDALFRIRNLRSVDASRLALPALRDKSAIVRATAASSVVSLPAEEAAYALLRLLSDKEEFVRREAAYALGEVGDSTGVLPLTKSLTGDKSQEVRSAAAAALGKTGDPTAVGPLATLLAQRSTEENEMLRRATARSIGQIAQIMRSGRKRILTPQNFLPDKHKDVGPAPSPELLMHFRNAVTTLIGVLDSSAEADDTRREAAFALGAIGDRSAEAILVKYTNSSDLYLAEICREALLKLRPAG